MPPFSHDITVIGAGHAGIEAAHIAAKMGASVLLITGNADLIGQMSCNPAIGGVAKGNIVREIDAMGGLMASLIDRAGIHFRMLNATKGSAVWGPRAQADRTVYRDLARKEIERNPKIDILQAMVTAIDANRKASAGEKPPRLRVFLDNGENIDSKTVVIAAGTFLNGTIHIGTNTFLGGRAGEPPSCSLTESLCALGITSGRLKTSTPPRIDGRTADYARFTVQRGDADPWPFSFFTHKKLCNQIVCWTTKTNKITHQHITDNLDMMLSRTGKVQPAGPRYCPSIEEKIIRFGERDGHTLYLEPEDANCRELYINGFSTALPYSVQERMVRSVEGLEDARIMRPGYGIEYDYFQPQQLKPTLESKIVPGLFFAGQVNGTSGYEEAACQGLVAGINAVRQTRGEAPVILGRDTSYIGVLIDDLVTKGTDEPYRMFTSRAEHRLILRQDNCDERLMPIARELGTVTQEQYDERRRFWDRKQVLIRQLGEVRVTPDQYRKIANGSISQTGAAADFLKRPEFGLERMLEVIENIGDDAKKEVMSITCGQNVDNICDSQKTGVTSLFDRHLILGVESDIKYEGFVRKQIKEIEKIRRFEETIIPDDFSYESVPGLLAESREKLKKNRPNTLGQASRIGGVTPADISVLAVYLLRFSPVSVI